LQRPPLLIFLEAATVGMLLYGLIISPIIAKVVGDPTTLNHSSTAKVQRHWTPYRIWLFYAGSLLVAGGILLPWIGWKIQCEPFTWVFTLLFTGQRKLVLCGAWIVAILFSVLLFNKLDSSMTKEAQKTHTKAQLYLRRKFFHALSIFMFTPGILYEPQFMHLAFSVSICAFILLEYLRTLRVPPLGEALHAFFTRFLDHRDAGPIILAHVYLLLGCAVPLWLYGGAANSEARLAVLAGIITLGFGDAMASTIGIRYGRHRWPGTNKTIEGTFAFILCTQLSPWVLGLRLSVSQFPALLIITTLAGALECVSQQNDNLLLPPVIFAAFRLAHL
jgi:dolichol kinase